MLLNTYIYLYNAYIHVYNVVEYIQSYNACIHVYSVYVHTYTMLQNTYSIKKNEMLPLAATWMDLVGIRLGKLVRQRPTLYAIPYKRACVCVHAKLLHHVRLFVTSWTVARQSPLSMGFSRQEY